MKRFLILFLFAFCLPIMAQNNDQAYPKKTSQEIDNLSYSKTSQAFRVVIVPNIDVEGGFGRIFTSTTTKDSIDFGYYFANMSFWNYATSTDTLYISTDPNFSNPNKLYKIAGNTGVTLHDVKIIYAKFGYIPTGSKNYGVVPWQK